MSCVKCYRSPCVCSAVKFFLGDILTKEELDKVLDSKSEQEGISSQLKNLADQEASLLIEADTITNGPRREEYSHPLDDFSKTAKIWTGILLPKLKEGVEITPEEVALLMVGLKLSREAFKHKRDNLVDGIGYLNTVNMVIKERERRNAL